MAKRNNLEELLHRVTLCAEEGMSPAAVDSVLFQLCRIARQRGLCAEEREFIVGLVVRWRDIIAASTGYQ